MMENNTSRINVKLMPVSVEKNKIKKIINLNRICCVCTNSMCQYRCCQRKTKSVADKRAVFVHEYVAQQSLVEAGKWCCRKEQRNLVASDGFDLSNRKRSYQHQLGLILRNDAVENGYVINICTHDRG